MDAEQAQAPGDEALLNFVYQIPVAVLRSDAQGAVDLMNPHAVSLLASLRLPHGPDCGLALLEALDSGLAHRTRNALDAPGVVAKQVAVERVDPSGNSRHLVVSVHVVDPGWFMLVIDEVTRRVEQERQLWVQRRGLEVVLQNIHGYCVITLDLQLRVVQSNASVERLLGHGTAVVGMPLSDLLDLGEADLQQRAREALSRGWVTLEAGVRKRDGSRLWGDMVLSVVVDERGEPACLIAVIHDATERHRREVDTRQQALHDPLTGLLNRRGLDEWEARWNMLQALDPPEGQSLSVVAIDVDHFKKVNDTEGHAAGDAVLKALGDLLRRSSREDDLAVRLGGEEFALVLPNVPLGQAAGVAERLRDRLQHTPVAWQGRSLAVTASFGLASGAGAVPLPDLLAAADAALYQAKLAGRNRVQIAAPSDAARTPSLGDDGNSGGVTPPSAPGSRG